MGKRCSFSGNRILKNPLSVETAALAEIKKLISEGFTDFYAGGAIGFDTIAALAVLKLKSQGENIRLTIVVPFAGQEEKWHSSQVELYKSVLSQADEIITLSNKYTKDCYLQRNRFLVDNCDCLMAFQRKLVGGTAYTISYAKKKGKRIVEI